MTDRRQPAAASRILVAGGSVAVTLGLVAAMATGTSGEAVTLDASDRAGRDLRIVLTDARIDPRTAVPAARDAAARGATIVRVPVGRVTAGATKGGHRAPHTTTRSS